MVKPVRTADAKTLSTWQIAVFGMVYGPLAIAQMPLNMVVPYYTQTLGLSLTLIGFLLLMGRILDVGLDLGMAFISDSLPTRYGRRRPWVIAGLILMVPVVWLLFIPYPSMSVTRFGIGIFLFFVTWTMAFIPYLSQGTELSSDPHERSALNISQSVVGILTIMAGYFLPFLLVDKRTFAIRDAIGDKLAGLRDWGMGGLIDLLHTTPLEGVASYGRNVIVIVIVTTISAPIVMALYAFFVPDRSAASHQTHGSMIDALRNRLFYRFSLGYLVLIFGYLGRTGLFPFILAFWFQRADMYLILVLVQFVTALVVTPVWSLLFKKLERRTCMALAAMAEAVALLALALIPAGNDALLIFCYVLIGLPGQTLLMGAYLIAADSADYAKWKFGTESRAMHVSIVSLIVKAGNIAAALSIWAAGLFGFNPKLIHQPPETIMMLKIIGLYLPLVLLVAGGLIILTHPMTKRRQRAVQRRLDLREAASAAAMVSAEHPPG